MPARELYCDRCHGVQPFEVPPCADGHGAECPELACIRCGSAVLVTTFQVGSGQGHRRGRGLLRQHAA